MKDDEPQPFSPAFQATLDNATPERRAELLEGAIKGRITTDPSLIECRAAIEISPTATNEILFLPIGLHAITPIAGGIGRPIKVKVDRKSVV